jgi:hypothetical protein
VASVLTEDKNILKYYNQMAMTERGEIGKLFNFRVFFEKVIPCKLYLYILQLSLN